MSEKFKRALSKAIGGCIVWSSIIYPFAEEPHIHPEQYDYYNDYSEKGYTAVVSGELLKSEYPEYIKEIGPSPYKENETLFAITIPFDE